MDENKTALSTEKKFRMSPMTIVCYVLAALVVIYMFYVAGNTVGQINDYFAQFQQKAKATDYFMYVSQALASPAITCFTFFMLGYILDAVKRADPKSYKSDAEIEDEKMAKREAKDAKAFAKGEKAAAKASEKTEDKVAADFANSLDKELKASGESASRSGQRKPAARKTGAKNTGERKTGAKKSDEQSRSNGQKKSQSQSKKSSSSAAKKTSQRKTSDTKKAAKKPADVAENIVAEKREDDSFKVEISE